MSRRRPRADATRIVALLFVALAMSAAMAALALSLMRRRDAGATARITQPVAAGEST